MHHCYNRSLIFIFLIGTILLGCVFISSPTLRVIDAVHSIQGRYEIKGNALVSSMSGVSLSFVPNQQTVEVLIESVSSNDSLQWNRILVVDQDFKAIDTFQLFPGKHWYVLHWTGIPNVKTVTFIKLTEAFVGKIYWHEIKGVSKRNGQIQSPSQGILFIGNSITCGYGNQVMDNGSANGFHAINESAFDAYAFQTALQLNAPVELLCFSGIGIYRNFDTDTLNTMSKIFQRIHLADTSSLLWNPNLQLPSLICVNLGTNDYFGDSQDQPLNETAFKNSYISFINKLHQWYPEAKILIMNGSMLNDYWPPGKKCLSRIQQRLLEVKEIVNAQYPSLVETFIFQPQQAPYGEDYHPSKITHLKMANELTQFIKSHNLYTHE